MKENRKKMCLWQVASSTPFEHKIMQHMSWNTENWKYFIIVGIANHASFLSRISAVVTRTGCTAVVNECKKLSVLGKMLHSKREEYMFWCLHLLPACAVPVQKSSVIIINWIGQHIIHRRRNKIHSNVFNDWVQGWPRPRHSIWYC